MPKLKKEDITRLKKALKKIKFTEIVDTKVIIAFPLDMTVEKSISGFTLSNSTKETYGKEKKPEAVVCIMLDQVEDNIHLGYADTTFSKKFDFVSFCDLFDFSLSKNDAAWLDELECVLLDKENLFFAI